MDAINVKGIRIGPIPQQSGAPTIQQAIYQAHNSVCGVNTLVYDRIGITKIRYIDLKEILDSLLNANDTITAWKNLGVVGTTYLQDATPENRILYIQALSDWAKVIFTKAALTPPPSGYTYGLTVYDSNGTTIWDSKTPQLVPIVDGIIPRYTKVDLTTPNPFKEPNGSTRTSANLYGIANNPGYLAYISDETTQKSAFMVNQAAFPETVMAVASQISDPANTRVFGFMNYGFSARQQNPNSDDTNIFGSLAYYCVHLTNIYTVPNATYPLTTLIETVFVRIGLLQAPPI
jgi:hypothetical protein